ncbi:MAG: hypothetical protein WBN70_11765 [Polyangiales bacterium]
MPAHRGLHQPADALSTPDEFELEVLEIFGDTPDKVRLCYQARLARDVPAQVTLRVCDDKRRAATR